MIHVVDQGFLHIGRVGVVVVQDELVQSEAGLTLHIVVEFQLEAVAVSRGIVGDVAEAGIALRADADLIEGLSANLHSAGVVFL